MLRPSRPMMRPFISSDGRWTTETVCSAVWSAATRWIAVMTMSRALSWASSRALRSMARAIFTASCSASSRTASMRMLRASSAFMFATRSRAATCSPWARARSSRVLSSSRSRSRSLRSRCSSMSVRWSSCSSRWRSRLSSPDSSARRARASSSASRCMRSFSSFASRISSFWRARASASIRRASEVAAFIVCEAQRLRTRKPTTTPPTAATTATARMIRGSIFCSSHPAGRAGGSCCCGRSFAGGRTSRRGRGGPLPGPRPSRCCAARRQGGTWFVCRVAYGRATPRVNRPATEPQRSWRRALSRPREARSVSSALDLGSDRAADLGIEAVAGEQRVGALAPLAGIRDAGEAACVACQETFRGRLVRRHRDLAVVGWDPGGRLATLAQDEVDRRAVDALQTRVPGGSPARRAVGRGRATRPRPGRTPRRRASRARACA